MARLCVYNLKSTISEYNGAQQKKHVVQDGHLDRPQFKIEKE